MSSMLRVVVERAGQLLRDETFRNTIVTIGRDATNDISLDDSYVSSQHVIVKRDGDVGDYRLFDESVNGTYWEGERVRTLRFRKPTVIRIGDYQLTFIPVQRTGTVEAPLVDPRAPTLVDEEIPPADIDLSTSPHEQYKSDPQFILGDAELRSISRSGEMRSLIFVDSALIGRATDCDLQFASRDISRRHAVILAGAKGYTIRRLSTKNGVEVNDRELAVGETMPLRDGDVIRICDEELVFLYPATRPKGSDFNIPLDAAPNLDLAVHRRGCNDPDVTAVDIVGFLGAKTWNKFEDQMMRYVQGSRRLLIDLGYLVGIDGNGIASLGRVIKEAENLGILIQVIRLTPRIADVLSYSALKPLLDRYISNSEETAIRRLRD